MIRARAMMFMLIGALQGCGPALKIEQAPSLSKANLSSNDIRPFEVGSQLPCDLTQLVSIKNDVELPSFEEGQPKTFGTVKSTMTFKEVKKEVEQGKSGILVEESLVVSYNEPITRAMGRRFYSFFDRSIRSAESCQFSIVGTNINSSGPETILSADFQIRKCVGSDYPCGETCEVNWDYQACRTKMCRLTAITNGPSGQVVMRVNARPEFSETTINIRTTASFTSDISEGDIANVLSGIGLNPETLLGVVPPSQFSQDLVNNLSVVKVPQQAFIYKPTITDAAWITVDSQEFSNQATEAIAIQRKQTIERTAACSWLTCQRSSNPDQCVSQM